MVNLNKGDLIHFVEESRIRFCTYLCIHPNNSKYHILINENKDPFRVYEPDLVGFIKQGHKSWQDAALMLADKLEAEAKFLRSDEAFSN